MLDIGKYEYTICYNDNWLNNKYYDSRHKIKDVTTCYEIEKLYNKYIDDLNEYIQDLKLQQDNRTAQFAFIDYSEWFKITKAEIKDFKISITFDLVTPIDENEMILTIRHHLLNYFQFYYFENKDIDILFNLFDVQNKYKDCWVTSVACEETEKITKIK